MLGGNRYALKEWAVVLGRLGKGDQVILPRKGGILESREGFRVEHREFFLFPTRFHGQGEAPPSRVDLRLYASVEEDLPVAELDALRRLEGMHSVPWEDVERRFHYGAEKGVHALVLRAWRLDRAHTLDDARAYEGCRSWVELREELPVVAAAPALPDGPFEEKRRAVRDALHG